MYGPELIFVASNVRSVGVDFPIWCMIQDLPHLLVGQVSNRLVRGGGVSFEFHVGSIVVGCLVTRLLTLTGDGPVEGVFDGVSEGWASVGCCDLRWCWFSL